MFGTAEPPVPSCCTALWLCRERGGRGDGHTGEGLHPNTMDDMFAVKKRFQKS